MIQSHLFNIFTLKHDLRIFVEKMLRFAFMHLFVWAKSLRIPGLKFCHFHSVVTLDWEVRFGFSTRLLESQALQYRIWNLGPSSRKLHKGKIWDFGTKLGLFWDHFYTLLGLLVVIFIKMPQNLQKAKKALKTVLSQHLMQRVFWIDIWIFESILW